LKLIDALGSEAEAIKWLEEEKKIASSLPVRDWKRRKNLEGLGLLGLGSALAGAAGLPEVAAWLQKSEEIQRASVLDGLMSIWHSGGVN